MNRTRERASNAVPKDSLVNMGLPEFAFVHVRGNKPGERIGVAERGELGYKQSQRDMPNENEAQVEARIEMLNTDLGVTKAQRMAMEAGSMWGWHVPGANPKVWMD